MLDRNDNQQVVWLPSNTLHMIHTDEPFVLWLRMYVTISSKTMELQAQVQGGVIARWGQMGVGRPSKFLVA